MNHNYSLGSSVYALRTDGCPLRSLELGYCQPFRLSHASGMAFIQCSSLPLDLLLQTMLTEQGAESRHSSLYTSRTSLVRQTHLFVLTLVSCPTLNLIQFASALAFLLLSSAILLLRGNFVSCLSFQL